MPADCTSACRTTARPIPRRSCSSSARAIRRIRDWDDLVKPESGHHAKPEDFGRRALELSRRLGLCGRKGRRREPARWDFVAAIYKNVPVLDTGARGSTTTFAQRGIGDVAISWENEAFLSLKEFGEDKFEIVVPSISILAEPPVTIVDGNVEKGTRKVAQAYLEFLYDREAQAIIAKNFYRPSKPEAAAKEDRALPENEVAQDRRRLRWLGKGAEAISTRAAFRRDRQALTHGGKNPFRRPAGPREAHRLPAAERAPRLQSRSATPSPISG